MANIEPDDAPFLLLRTATADDMAAAEALLGSTCSEGSELWVLVDPADEPDDRVHGAVETRPAGPGAVELTRFATHDTDPGIGRHLLVGLANVLRRRGCRAIMMNLGPDQATQQEILHSLGSRPVDPDPSGDTPSQTVRRWLLEL